MSRTESRDTCGKRLRTWINKTSLSNRKLPGSRELILIHRMKARPAQAGIGRGAHLTLYGGFDLAAGQAGPDLVPWLHLGGIFHQLPVLVKDECISALQDVQ